MSDSPGKPEHLLGAVPDPPSQPFDDWRRAVAALSKAEKCGAPHAELLRFSAEVIRTRNVLALDRLAAGLPLPDQTSRYLSIDERLLSEEDDTAHDDH